jgi:Tat protein secretion system quality control protein TatD with DNase activity
LVASRGFVRDLLDTTLKPTSRPIEEVKKVIADQSRFAQERQKTEWLTEVARDCAMLDLSNHGWIIDNVGPVPQRQRQRQYKAYYQDYRLEQNPNLERHVHDADILEITVGSNESLVEEWPELKRTDAPADRRLSDCHQATESKTATVTLSAPADRRPAKTTTTIPRVDVASPAPADRRPSDRQPRGSRPQTDRSRDWRRRSPRTTRNSPHRKDAPADCRHPSLTYRRTDRISTPPRASQPSRSKESGAPADRRQPSSAYRRSDRISTPPRASRSKGSGVPADRRQPSFESRKKSAEPTDRRQPSKSTSTDHRQPSKSTSTDCRQPSLESRKRSGAPADRRQPSSEATSSGTKRIRTTEDSPYQRPPSPRKAAQRARAALSTSKRRPLSSNDLRNRLTGQPEPESTGKGPTDLSTKRHQETETTSQAKKAKRRPPPKAPRVYPCPVPECDVPNRYTKYHAFDLHVPDVFAEYRPEGDISTLRLAALNMLATYILGSTATISKLATYLGTCHLLKKEGTTVVSPAQDACMRSMCRELNIEEPQVFTLEPLNSPAALVHWRAINQLVAYLTSARRAEFLNAFPVRSQRAQQQTDPVDCYQPEAAGGHLYQPSSFGEEVEVEELLPGAFDSHYHHDRSCDAWGVPRGTSFNGLVELAGQLNPEHRIQLEGAVANYCDPGTWPTLSEIQALAEENVLVTVGFHPKSSPLMTDGVLRQFQELLALPEVVGVGEIGLDDTAPRSKQMSQRRILAEILPLVSDTHVLVLHCRGAKKTVQSSSEACLNLLYLVQAALKSRDQKIHLHCYNGSKEVVKEWLRVFPNTYFGFTRMVRLFSAPQIEGLKSVPNDRLLLETDAPYFPFEGWTNSSPALLGLTAAAVSQKLEMLARDVLLTTSVNGRTLYSGRE